MIRATMLGTASALSILLVSSAPAEAQAINYGASLPNPNIPGYNFPEPEDVILGWINGQPAATPKIYLHGWGLWASLTAPSGMTAYSIANAPVYLTWLSKGELQQLSQPGLQANAVGTSSRRLLALGAPAQLLKFGIDTTRAPLRVQGVPQPVGAVTPDTTTFETVAYDPEAAGNILQAGLFKLSTIEGFYAAGKTEIPAFKPASVSVKPVYKAITAAKLINGRYYAMPAWQGTPTETDKIKAKGCPETSWSGCVYVDVQNTGTSKATGVDPTCMGPTPASTYGLGDFISLPVTKDNVDQFKLDGLSVAAGDSLILMAMHATSREITEWTWQTYFWTPNPKQPPLPSAADVAAAMPTQLSGPATHYAISFAYQMVSPNQPVTGGVSKGSPVIGYNPYLEAGFNAKVFSGFLRPIADTQTGHAWIGTVGVESNCMTCHSMATVAFAKDAKTHYATDFYISRVDPAFKGTLQTDFLWSIADVAAAQQPKKK